MSRPRAVKKEAPYHHGDLRRVILETALELLAEKGESSVTLREIARRAGVSHAAPYRHFSDHRALLAALNDEGFMALRHALEAATAKVSAAAPVSRLLVVAETYVDFAAANPARYRLMFAGPRHAAPDGSNVPAEVFAYVAGLVAEAQAQGALRQENVKLMTNMIWATVHGIASLALNQRLVGTETGDNSSTLAREAIAALIKGLAP
ncbi:MAG: TetR/AcrR family transcriptional regulator [Desulfobacteraceae bacterium]|nr:TetR/AcrR family transcriptional regulator [Desulfobacteraceae bacterium]